MFSFLIFKLAIAIKESACPVFEELIIALIDINSSINSVLFRRLPSSKSKKITSQKPDNIMDVNHDTVLSFYRKFFYLFFGFLKVNKRKNALLKQGEKSQNQ